MPTSPESQNDRKPIGIKFRKTVMWGETVIAALALLSGTLLLVSGLVFGHRDPCHGGAYSIFFGAVILLAAVVLGFCALCLRGSSRSGWIFQVFPLAILAWLLWDTLSHAG